MPWPGCVQDVTSGLDVLVAQRYDVWRPMMNTFGANWELSQLPSPPLDIRITNVYGQQVLLKWVPTRNALAAPALICVLITC